MKREDISFWITNISDRNVSLADLNLTIKAWSSINLLDKKHYSYSLEQLKKSAENGSLMLKRDKIAIRRLAPEVEKKNLSISQNYIPDRSRSVMEIKYEQYEELDIFDAIPEEDPQPNKSRRS